MGRNEMGKQTFAYSITPALKKPHINTYPKHREVISHCLPACQKKLQILLHRHLCGLCILMPFRLNRVNAFALASILTIVSNAHKCPNFGAYIITEKSLNTNTKSPVLKKKTVALIKHFLCQTYPHIKLEL